MLTILRNVQNIILLNNTYCVPIVHLIVELMLKKSIMDAFVQISQFSEQWSDVISDEDICKCLLYLF